MNAGEILLSLTDLGKDFEVIDTTGEHPLTGIISDITRVSLASCVHSWKVHDIVPCRKRKVSSLF